MRYNFEAEDFQGEYSDGQDCPLARLLRRNNIEFAYVSSMGYIKVTIGYMKAKDIHVNGEVFSNGFDFRVYEDIVSIIQVGDFQSASVEIK